MSPLCSPRKGQRRRRRRTSVGEKEREREERACRVWEDRESTSFHLVLSSARFLRARVLFSTTLLSLSLSLSLCFSPLSLFHPRLPPVIPGLFPAWTLTSSTMWVRETLRTLYGNCSDVCTLCLRRDRAGSKFHLEFRGGMPRNGIKLRTWLRIRGKFDVQGFCI